MTNRQVAVAPRKRRWLIRDRHQETGELLTSRKAD